MSASRFLPVNALFGKSSKLSALALIAIFVFQSMVNIAHSQQNASPCNWLYPNGNPEATRYQRKVSGQQDIKDFSVKWTTSAICGDVQPLIGNVVRNSFVNLNYRWAPNEIVAVVGDKIVVVDATGKTIASTKFPETVHGVKAVSVLYDTASSYLSYDITNPVMLGLETNEMENLTDSMAFAYTAGYNETKSNFDILNRMAIDLRPFAPNFFASIKPVFGRKDGKAVSIYATVNMNYPQADSNSNARPAFFRGVTQFYTSNLLSTYPLPDVGDLIAKRMIVAPEVNFSTPSLTNYSKNKTGMLMPVLPSASLNTVINNPTLALTTSANAPYLMGFNIFNHDLAAGVGILNLTNLIPASSSKPQIRPYYIHLKDINNVERTYILVAEEYRGTDSSSGRPKLHLFDSTGFQITFPYDIIPNPNLPMSFNGDSNHLWSVAVGNVDGKATNKWLPYFPNNPGNEIIVTQSTREFSVANNKLIVLRYRKGAGIAKPTPPYNKLSQFDTVATQRINGWVAAVNDLDGGDDGKDEIILVDGPYLRIMRLKDYNDIEFRLGRPFDTVFTYTFPNQTISNVAVADLEGDGLNDIIVTTFDSTYVIGNILRYAIKVITPMNSQTLSYCAGDTVQIKWINLIKSRNGVNIRYHQQEKNNVPNDTIITIVSNYANLPDTNSYFYAVDTLLMGTKGYFIIENSDQPGKIFDLSSTVILEKPSIEVNPYSTYEYTPGERIVITGSVSCFDSVVVDYTYRNSSTFYSLGTVITKNETAFNTSAEIPCPGFFQCYGGPDPDSLLLIRITGIKGTYRDENNQSFIKIRPIRMPVRIDSCPTACQTRTFHWDALNTSYPCDSVTVSVSYDGGQTFSQLATVHSSLSQYVWQVPINLPDRVIFRFCCESSCIRVDTVITDAKVKLISIVAPNPFRPPNELVEVIYKVPVETYINIRIYDKNNRLVAEPVKDQSRHPATSYCDRWDGTIWNGSYAANGMYYLSLELSNGVKEVYPIFIRK